MNYPVKPLAYLDQHLELVQAILIIQIDILLPVTPGGYMVKCTCILYSDRSSHLQSILDRCCNVRPDPIDPFIYQWQVHPGCDANDEIGG
jgi:hypothetical protein